MRTGCLGVASALLLAAAAAPRLRAQSASGRITGTVTDSVHAKPAAGAIVLFTRLSPEPAEFRSILADAKGRYTFDGLAAGRYAIAFATGYLDSLHITLAPREVVLGPGETAQADFVTPSGATLRAAACPGLPLPRGQGAVVGQVSDADTDTPLPGATVVVSWTDLSVEKATLRPVTTRRAGSVTSDSLGRYHLCGVPTDSYLVVQLQEAGRAGSALTLRVDDAGGVLVHDLSLSVSSARRIASLDSAAAPASGTGTAAPKPLTGTATLTGVVQTPAGQPLSQAQLRIRDAAGVARTDSLGRFTLTGQPAGSQLLEVRHVGYLPSQVAVELRSGKAAETTVILTRIVNLDSIRIVARRSPYPEFEQRRAEGFGRYLDEAAIEHLHAMETSDLFRMIPGFTLEGSGPDVRLFTTHGKFDLSGRGPCEVNVVVDGNQHVPLNQLDPDDIGAIEAYPGPAGAPIQYDRACGVIVIWRKRAAPAPARSGAAPSG